jgi:hypothetical protein
MARAGIYSLCTGVNPIIVYLNFRKPAYTGFWRKKIILHIVNSAHLSGNVTFPFTVKTLFMLNSVISGNVVWVSVYFEVFSLFSVLFLELYLPFAAKIMNAISPVTSVLKVKARKVEVLGLALKHRKRHRWRNKKKVPPPSETATAEMPGY